LFFSLFLEDVFVFEGGTFSSGMCLSPLWSHGEQEDRHWVSHLISGTN
jgi:hypothetical protein